MTVIPPPSFDRMTLRLYDTRSRVKRIFEPLVEGEVGIYVCGITPYSPSHIGHARQAIAFDIIVRWFRKSGYKVNHITNFTDIDDKIIAIAGPIIPKFGNPNQPNVKAPAKTICKKQPEI